MIMLSRIKFGNDPLLYCSNESKISFGVAKYLSSAGLATVRTKKPFDAKVIGVKEIGKLLSETWRIKGLAEQEYGPQHPLTKRLAVMHEDIQKLLRE